MTQAINPGQLKQDLIRIYNAINRDMFAVGVRQQRVDLLGDKILIVAEHERIPAMACLDPQHRPITRIVDALLLDEYKRRLKERVETLTGAKVYTVLKDYDPLTQMAGTLILLHEPLELSPSQREG